MSSDYRTAFMQFPDSQTLPFGITLIETGLQRPGLAACYLVQRGDDVAVIETGTAYTVPRILNVMSTLGIAREQVKYVAPTHVHLDHAAGAGALMRELPNAKLVIHPRGARHMIDPSQLIAGAGEVYGPENLQRIYGEFVPTPEERVTVADDGLKLPFGESELLFIDTPGHAKHHFCVWDEVSQGFFTGDSFGLSYREFDVDGRVHIFPPTTPIHFDPAAWHSTIDRLLSFKPKRMFLTHYGMIEDIDALAITLKQRINDYASIARQHALEPNPQTAIHDALEISELRMLEAHGCTLPMAERKRVLALDNDTNAQGLCVWLAKQSQ